MATSKQSIMDLVRRKKQDLQAQSGRREKTVKPTVGKNRFRILPGWRGGDDPTFFHDFGQHFIKDSAGKLQAVYMCSEKTFGRPCPICQAVAEGINNAEDDTLIKALKESQSKGRILMNALHLDGDDPNTPVILDLTPTTFEKVLELVEEYGDITDLEEGKDIIINRTGTGLNTEYSVLPAGKSNPVPKTALKSLHNLDEYVKQEFEQGKVKALTAVSAVAGLPAPEGASAPAEVPASRDVPLTPAPSESVSEAPATSDSSVVLDGEYEPVAAEAPATPAASAPAADESSELSDDEMDALLADLDG